MSAQESGGYNALRNPQESRSTACPLRCGYVYPIPACVRLHLIQHHDYTYAEAQEAHPDAF